MQGYRNYLALVLTSVKNYASKLGKGLILRRNGGGARWRLPAVARGWITATTVGQKKCTVHPVILHT